MNIDFGSLFSVVSRKIKPAGQRLLTRLFLYIYRLMGHAYADVYVFINSYYNNKTAEKAIKADFTKFKGRCCQNLKAIPRTLLFYFWSNVLIFELLLGNFLNF